MSPGHPVCTCAQCRRWQAWARALCTGLARAWSMAVSRLSPGSAGPRGTQSGSGQSSFMGHWGVRIKESCPSLRDSWTGGTELGRTDPGEGVAGTRPTKGCLRVSCCFVLKTAPGPQGRPSVGLQTQPLVPEQKELVTWTLLRQSQWLFPTFLAVSLKEAQGDDSRRAHTSAA